MRSAGLGRLGNALGSGSDQAKNGTVHRRGEAFSASGWVHVRSKSKRAVGALEAYTEGAEIRPRRGQWLWMATRQISQKAGRQKMTPALYRASGLEQRLGPLVQIQTSPGEALLIVENVSVDKFGRMGRKARKIGKTGRLSKGRRRADMIVAFVGIRRTSRAARVTPSTIAATNAAKLPALIAEELRKET
ncbi:MAG TPA: hypothetical protein VGB70_06620 [Allosphingosinicella sp.]|jgi:hypothetical protein